MQHDEASLRQDERAARFRLLTETSAGTLMGTLMRSFWQPIANASKIKAGEARPVLAMGEELTVYRGESGKPYLIGGRCAHRCTVLHTGHIQGEQIRCMYHGWRYDGTGQCTEMPAEKNARPGAVKIVSYPVHEYGSLIFAYLGDGPAPAFDLPRKEALEDPTRNLYVFEEIYDCSWFQQIENSLDAAHVSFAHVWGRMSRFGEEISTSLPELEYSETGAGVRQVATRGPGNVRISDWTFPNNNYVMVPGPQKGDPWSPVCVWAVPMDDETTMRFTVISSQAGDTRLASEVKPDFQPCEQREALFRQEIPKLGSTQFLSVQDYVAVRGQGRIVNRMNERLGQTDAGIALVRRMFYRELDAITAGKPTKQWTRVVTPVDLPIPRPDRKSAATADY